MLEPQYFGGEHLIFTSLAFVVLMGAFLTLSLVMFWAPGKKQTWDEPDEALNTAEINHDEANPDESQPERAEQ